MSRFPIVVSSVLCDALLVAGRPLAGPLIHGNDQSRSVRQIRTRRLSVPWQRELRSAARPAASRARLNSYFDLHVMYCDDS